MRLIFDIEGDGIEPTKFWCISALDVDTRDIYEFGPSELKDGFELLDSADTLIGHNIIGYDLPYLKSLYGVDLYHKELIDTLVWARTYNPTQEGGHSLDAFGYRLDFPKVEHEDWSRYTAAMQHRCTMDVRLNLKVYNFLVKKMGKAFPKEALELEQDVAKIITKQINHGWCFKTQDAYVLRAKVNDELGRLEDKVHETFKPKTIVEKVVTPKRKKDGNLSKQGLRPEEYEKLLASGSFEPFNRLSTKVFNLGSRQQIGEWLQDFGWVPVDFTETGLPKVDEKVLESIKGIPEADLINDYLAVSKIRGFLTNWIDSVHEDGRQRGYVNPHGAVTGRMSHSKPNLAQVPSKRKRFGSECRELFTVPKDYTLVGMDAKGLEFRMLAHYMNDRNYIEAAESGNSDEGTDLHSVNMRMAGLNDRDQAKTMYYAFMYGAGDAKLGLIVGGTKKHGKDLKETMFKNVPALSVLIERVHERAGFGFLKNLDGRPIRVRNVYSSLNTLLQGAGALVMKRALVLLDSKAEAAGLDYHFVGNIHDEIQSEVHNKDVEAFCYLGYEAFLEAGEYYNLRCKIECDAHTGLNWSETH